jgi:hypothetical protein
MRLSKNGIILKKMDRARMTLMTHTNSAMKLNDDGYKLPKKALTDYASIILNLANQLENPPVNGGVKAQNVIKESE